MAVALKPSKGWNAGRERGNRWKGNSARLKAQSHMSAWVMQDVILDHLDERSPRTKEELAEDLAYDYGAFEVRTLYRNLADLIELGLVAREEEYALHLGKMIPVYRRLSKRMPPPGHRRKVAPRNAVEPLNADPVGPWPGFRVLLVSERYSPRPLGPVSVAALRKKCPRGYFKPSPNTVRRKARASRAARRPSAQNPGSRPPGASASRPARPPAAARRAR